MISPYYSTKNGSLYLNDSIFLLMNETFNIYLNKINLIFTSPPFPLNRKKKYGNFVGKEYINWFSNLSKILSPYLTDNGSIVIELGNAWNPGSPTYSTLPIESLLEFKRSGRFHLCQEFIYFNPTRLPTPVEWVNKKRIRVKDSFTKIWWLSKTDYPYANNRDVLIDYSKSMKKLLLNGKYNSGRRPSEHIIGKKSFLKDNKGAIPANVLIASNTKNSDKYINYCKNNNIELHPARMPEEIPSFFIKFLTKPNEIVLDPFCGSNTTGAIAEILNRRWISIELNKIYADGSMGRFKKIKFYDRI